MIRRKVDNMSWEIDCIVIAMFGFGLIWALSRSLNDSLKEG